MTALKHLRIAAFLEGVSLLVLFGVAMPLKYVWDMPLAVRVVGSLHGIFFVAFVSALYRVTLERRWSKGRTLSSVGYALLPGGTFVLDRALVREMNAVDAEQKRAA